MKRRDLIGAIGAAAVCPIPAVQAAQPVVAVLFGGSAALLRNGVSNLLAGLGELGYAEGRNVSVEYWAAEGQYDRLPALATDLADRKVDVIIPLASPALLAAKAATSTIPVVFAIAADPVALGLVARLNRPGGNLTGTTFLSIELTAKQLELLHQLSPNDTTVGFLINPNAPDVAAQTSRAQEAARSLGLTIQVVNASTQSAFAPAFAALAERHTGALLIGGDEFFASEAARIAGLALQYKLPAIFGLRVFPASGGLASYGASLTEALHQAGVYAGRILKGAKPSDLPVVQTSKFELVINLKTAKALGVTVPTAVLAAADAIE